MMYQNLKKIVFLVLLFTSSGQLVYGQQTNSDSIVWPGDINNNGLVDNNDLLYLGAAYGLQGPDRDNQTIQWGPQFVPSNWAPTFITGLSSAFADCNGDGLVDDSDLQAIEVNYGLEHDTFYTDTFPINSGATINELIFETGGSQLQAEAGATYTIPVMIGTPNLPVNDFYGMAFNIEVNTDYVNLSSMFFEFDPSWVDPNGGGILELQKKNFDTNTFDLAFSRKDMNNASGYGIVGYVVFVIEDNVPDFAPNTEVLTIKNTYVVDNNLTQNYLVGDHSLLLDFTNPVQTLPQSEINIYPNPSTEGYCIIEGLEAYPNADVRLLDIAGRQMRAELTQEKLTYNDLPSGIYFVEINTQEGRLTQKIMIRN